MGEIIELNANKDQFEVEYIFEEERVVAVTHPEWPFRIMRNGEHIAFVWSRFYGISLFPKGFHSFSKTGHIANRLTHSFHWR